MVFSSLLFLFLFLPLFVLGYHLIEERYKNLFTLFASLVFYAWGAPDFVLIAIGSVIIDFYLIDRMSKFDSIARKWLLFGSLVLNVGLLLYFKYFNFFVENVNFLLGDEQIEWTKIVLPIGISFFTFQKISYSVDIYRKVEAPLKRLGDYALYILLFPQLIAGPIVRYKEIASQLTQRDHRDYQLKLQGVYRFCIGLAKKVLIANVLGEKADLIFGLEAIDIDSSVAWLGIICYTFQIYFDFSAYSDMAIGLGMLIGFKFPENFNSPYVSKSITEFWRRWHITLSSWMRDYLYIPLGGNRVSSQARLYLNLWIVFLISGFWHGASWNFIIWGAYHGFFIVMDRTLFKAFQSKIGAFANNLLTFFLVILSWVLFRAETLSDALDFYQRMFAFDFGSLYLFIDKKLLIMLLVGTLMSFGMNWGRLRTTYDSFVGGAGIRNSSLKLGLSLVLLIISAASLSSSGFNPFIYFRF